ncbi:MAG: NAD(P)H-hydrate epimerase [Pirellulaceae bacterium]
MHSLVLMENAALGCVQFLRERYRDSQPRTLILCGSGNNGGDGFAIARHLRILDWPCFVQALGPVDKLSNDARANAEILRVGEPDAIEWWHAGPAALAQLESVASGVDLIIDAMLGTGANGNPRPPFDRWIEVANGQTATRIAIDNPTGMNADDGSCGQPTFQAHITLTFVARKPGFASRHAACGDVHVLPIGVPNRLLEEEFNSKPR